MFCILSHIYVIVFFSGSYLTSDWHWLFKGPLDTPSSRMYANFTFVDILIFRSIGLWFTHLLQPYGMSDVAVILPMTSYKVFALNIILFAVLLLLVVRC